MYYHRLGTTQTEDVLIYKDPEHPEYMFSGENTLDGRFIVIDIKKDCGKINNLYLIDLEKTNHQIVGKNIFYNLIFYKFII